MERLPAALIKMCTVFVLVGVLLANLQEVEALTCFDCNEVNCTQPVNCTGGFALGICGCCYECAKQVHEQCGGLWGMDGTCDEGLTCFGDDYLDSGICIVDPKKKV